MYTTLTLEGKTKAIRSVTVNSETIVQSNSGKYIYIGQQNLLKFKTKLCPRFLSLLSIAIKMGLEHRAN